MLLAGLVLFPAVQPVQAAELEQKAVKRLPAELREKLEEIRQLLPELQEMELRGVDISEDDDYGPERWDYSFSKGTRWESTAKVVVDSASGRIHEFEYDPPEQEERKAPKEKEAREAAEHFLRQIWGEWADHYRYSSYSLDDLDYVGEDEATEAIVTYDLYLHDTKVEDFSIDVLVDGYERVVEMRNEAVFSVDEGKFPNPDEAIDEVEIAEIYQEQLDMRPIYRWIKEKGERKEKLRLVYEPGMVEGAIDALTGEISLEVHSRVQQKPERLRLQPKEKKLMAKSRAAAAKLVKDVFGVDVSRLKAEEEKDRLEIVYRWKTSNKVKKYYSVELRVNRHSGEVLEYVYDSNQSLPDKPEVSLEEAKEKAVEILETYLPAGKTEVLLSHTVDPYEADEYPAWIEPEEQPTWYRQDYLFYFSDMHQDVEVAWGGYTVGIDPETGKLVRLVLDGVNAFTEFPSTKGIISREEAAEAYARAVPLELRYVWPTYHDQKRSAPVLLYMQKNRDVNYVDAFTGKPIILAEE